MARGRFPIACLVVAATAAPFAVADLAAADLGRAEARAQAASVLHAVNAARRAHGLAPLRRGRRLGGSARAYALHMLRTGYFGHRARLRVACRCRFMGEVLAWHTGRRPRPRLVVRLWLASPPHRRLLLSSRFSSLGTGLARGRFLGRQATVWVGHLAG